MDWQALSYLFSVFKQFVTVTVTVAGRIIPPVVLSVSFLFPFVLCLFWSGGSLYLPYRIPIPVHFPPFSSLFLSLSLPLSLIILMSLSSLDSYFCISLLLHTNTLLIFYNLYRRIPLCVHRMNELLSSSRLSRMYLSTYLPIYLSANLLDGSM